MFGVVLASAVGVEYAYRRFQRKWLYGVGLALLAVLSMLTYQRSFVWSSSLALWEDVVVKNPYDARGYYNLSVVYAENQQFNLAINALKYVVLTRSYLAQEHIIIQNISFFYRNLGDYLRSSHYAIKAYQKAPNNVFIIDYVLQLENEFRDFQHASARCVGTAAAASRLALPLAISDVNELQCKRMQL
jgi:tetratricopeptide (TPR) repeat protein